MAINAGIPLTVQPVQPPDQMNMLAKVLAIKDAQQNQQVNALKMQETQRGIERRNKLDTLLAQDYATPDAREGALLRGGFAEEAMKLGKDRRENLKADSDRAKTELETGLKRAEHAASLFTLAKDPQSYGVVRALMKQQLGQDLPEQFDPNFVQAQIAMGQTITQKLAAEHQRLTLAETQRHNLTSEGLTARGQDITMRGQNMVDARSRESNQAQKDAARTQVVETPEGVMLIDKGTGLARPATTAAGKPLAGKPSAGMEKEMVGIRQQNAVIDGALQAVDQTPSAFGMTRGLATMAGPIPESVAGRMDSDAERQARSYVFNNVSKIINERAGAAQSAQELARLRSFLPAETDSAAQIKSKLQAFKKYLGDMESGTRGTSTPAGGATGGWSIQKVN